jgi:hypothetical protein
VRALGRRRRGVLIGARPGFSLAPLNGCEGGPVQGLESD